MTAQPLGLAGHALSRMGWGWLAPAVAMAAAASGACQRTPALAPTDWTCFPRLATRTAGPDARSVGTARDFCLSTMRRWGVTDRQDDVAVVVSELLTNALRHALPQAGPPPGSSHGFPDGPAGGPGRSRGAGRRGRLQPRPRELWAVADPSPRPPQPKEPDYLAESGRGLHVIDALSDRWGSTVPTDAGKVVWALFSVRLDRQPPDWGWFAAGRPEQARSSV
jgi:hypothetical protein